MKWHIKTTNGDVIGILELAHDLVVEPEAPKEPEAPPAPPRMVERKTMTEKAGNFTYDQYVQMGWTDNAMIASGVLKVTMEPVEDEAPAAQENAAPPPPTAEVHQTVQDEELGEEWGPVPDLNEAHGTVAPPPPQNNVAPPPPQAQTTQAPPPPQNNVAPPPPQNNVAPPPPQAQTTQAPPPPQNQGAAPPPPTQSGQASGNESDLEIPEGCELYDGPIPMIPGREFMVRNKSYERLIDAEKALFDGRIHGVTAQNVPATRKNGTFTKKRGVDKDEYGRLMVEQQSAWRNMGAGQTQGTEGAAPPPPQNQGNGMAPPPPPSQGTQAPPPPQNQGAAPPPPPSGANTAPPVPDNIADLEKELQEWGDEM